MISEKATWNKQEQGRQSGNGRATEMMRKLLVLGAIAAVLLVYAPSAIGSETVSSPPEIPAGYVGRIVFEHNDQRITCGPKTGYYFKPHNGDVSRLHFLTYNERTFYTEDLPANTKIFEGEAVLRVLDRDVEFTVSADDRVNAVAFADAPQKWLDGRPRPQDEFIYFRSCYDALGSVRIGYWLRHVGTASFTYDLGGRLTPAGLLYHPVRPGVDTGFAGVLEFDKGFALDDHTDAPAPFIRPQPSSDATAPEDP